MKTRSLFEDIRNSWEREIINLIIESCEVSNGDAQGIFEAQQGIIEYCYENAYPAKKAARIIIAASIA